MRIPITVLSFASATCLLCWQSAGALPAAPGTIKEATNRASLVQQARYYGHHHRRYITKCYYELIVGPYVCHRFYRW
jgi:hypothetical protein